MPARQTARALPVRPAASRRLRRRKRAGAALGLSARGAVRISTSDAGFRSVMPFRRSRVRMIRLSSHWPVPAGRQSKNSLLRTCCSSKPATLLFHAGQHAGRRLYRWPLPVSADLRRRSRLPEARVAQLVEQRIENPRVGGSNPTPGHSKSAVFKKEYLPKSDQRFQKLDWLSHGRQSATKGVFVGSTNKKGDFGCCLKLSHCQLRNNRPSLHRDGPSHKWST